MWLPSLVRVTMPALCRNPEVLRDVLLAGAERLLELADGGVAFAQVVKELDAHRLAEHPEALGNEVH